ncbi:MAG TPA: MarR family transcriptional regulator [Candidatus Acidoferrales bacterium]|jgi:DNA-binding transcriptional regulator GbsR (MarR family)|nr:MarR family transcriptional regulator [Candidatus Acidoferrales bacterium]
MPNLTAVHKKFILHWGEMGIRWGINRTVAQIHALLYLSPEPLDADEIAKTLGVARSNVSTSLRELQGWGIVRVVHLLGDRRDHFVTLTDVWEMFRIILEERKRREIDPTVRMLGECLEEVKKESSTDTYTRERIEAMIEFMSTMTMIYDKAKLMPRGALKALSVIRGSVFPFAFGSKKTKKQPQK